MLLQSTPGEGVHEAVIGSKLELHGIMAQTREKNFNCLNVFLRIYRSTCQQSLPTGIATSLVLYIKRANRRACLDSKKVSCDCPGRAVRKRVTANRN